MIGKTLTRLRERIRRFWTSNSSPEEIEGSGEVYLDPVHNSRYEAERELKRQTKLAEQAENGEIDEKLLEQSQSDQFPDSVHHRSR